MEGNIMTLAKTSNDWYPSFPSLINRFFDGELMDWNNSNFSASNTTLPAVNIRENENEYFIELAAPGMKKNDFKVDYDNGRLIISSEKKNEDKKEDGSYARHEFSYQSFQRSFTVSEKLVEPEKIAAKYEDGILSIRLPKREEVKPKPAKTIKIN